MSEKGPWGWKPKVIEGGLTPVRKELRAAEETLKDFAKRAESELGLAVDGNDSGLDDIAPFMALSDAELLAEVKSMNTTLEVDGLTYERLMQIDALIAAVRLRLALP